MERAQREHDLAIRTRCIADSLAPITASLAKPWDEQVAAVAATHGGRTRHTGNPIPDSAVWLDPAFRMVARFLKQIGPRRLAEMPLDARVVWATDPTPMQRDLGAAGRQA